MSSMLRSARLTASTKARLPSARCVGRFRMPVGFDEGGNGLQSGIEDIGDHSCAQIGIDLVGVGLSIDRRETHGEARKTVRRAARRACGSSAERSLSRRGRTELDLDALDRRSKAVQGSTGRWLIGGGKRDLERRKKRGVITEQPVTFQLADVQQDEGAEAFRHGAAYGFDDQHGGIQIGGDKVRRVGRCHIPRRIVFTPVAHMNAKEGKRAIDVKAPATFKVSPNRFPGVDTGKNIHRQALRAPPCRALSQVSLWRAPFSSSRLQAVLQHGQR